MPASSLWLTTSPSALGARAGFDEKQGGRGRSRNACESLTPKRPVGLVCRLPEPG